MQIHSSTQPWVTRAYAASAADASPDVPDVPDENGTEIPPGEVDESKFQLPDTEQPVYGSYADPNNPGEFISINTPEAAWQQVLTGQVNSLVAVEAAMMAGYQAVAADLSSQLADHGVYGLAGTRISYGVPVQDEGIASAGTVPPEPQFMVENDQYPGNASVIASILNPPDDEAFTNGFLKLGELSRTSSIFHAQSREQVLQEESIVTDGLRVPGQQYQFDFALRSNGSDWLMDGQLTRLPTEETPPLTRLPVG